MPNFCHATICHTLCGGYLHAGIPPPVLGLGKYIGLPKLVSGEETWLPPHIQKSSQHPTETCWSVENENDYHVRYCRPQRPRLQLPLQISRKKGWLRPKAQPAPPSRHIVFSYLFATQSIFSEGQKVLMKKNYIWQLSSADMVQYGWKSYKIQHIF